MRRLLPGIDLEQLEMDLPEIQSLDPHEVIEEKLREAAKVHPGPFIVEDTSLSIAGLGGLPGPLIKWFEKALSLENLASLAAASGDAAAQARTCIGWYHEGTIRFFDGVLEGAVVSPRGSGFGWDPIFQPEGFEKPFGLCAPEEKDRVSMRRLAAKKLLSALGTDA